MSLHDYITLNVSVIKRYKYVDMRPIYDAHLT